MFKDEKPTKDSFFLAYKFRRASGAEPRPEGAAGTESEKIRELRNHERSLRILEKQDAI